MFTQSHMARWITGLLALLVIITGCAPIQAPVTSAPTAASALSFTDATGVTVALPKAPERIACLTEICTDILYELGVEPVAVNDPLAYEPEFFGKEAEARIPRIGGSFFEPSLEDLAVAQPDLVIGLAGVHESLRDALQSIAPLYIMDPLHYNDSIGYLQEVGRLLGKAAEAEAAAQKFLDKLAAAKANAPTTTTIVLLGGSDVNIAVETTGGVYGSLLTELANYPWPPPAETSEHGATFVPYALEEILKVDPDVIFVESFLFSPDAKPVSEQLADHPLWKELKAVQSQQVYETRVAVWAYGRGTRSLSVVIDEVLARVAP